MPEGEYSLREFVLELDMAKNAGTSVRMRDAGVREKKINTLTKDEAGILVFARILTIIVVDIIVSSLFEAVRPHEGTVTDAMTAFFKARPILVWVFGALLAAAVGYWIVTLVMKRDTSIDWVTPGMCVAVALYLFVSVLSYTQNAFWRFPPLFYVMTVIVSVLIAVYYVYTILLYRK